MTHAQSVSLFANVSATRPTFSTSSSKGSSREDGRCNPTRGVHRLPYSDVQERRPKGPRLQ